MGDRYFFDLEDGDDVIRDDVGVEADSPEQAVESAEGVIAEMRARGDLPSGAWEMVIRSADGALVRKLPLL